MESAATTFVSPVPALERESAELRARRLAAARRAAWLADEGHAGGCAGHAADLVVTVAVALRDEDGQRVVTAELARAAGAVEVAPLAGRALRVLLAGGHHAGLFNGIVSGADRYLADHYPELRELVEAESPRWVPDAVYRRLVPRPCSTPPPPPAGVGGRPASTTLRPQHT